MLHRNGVYQSDCHCPDCENTRRAINLGRDQTQALTAEIDQAAGVIADRNKQLSDLLKVAVAADEQISAIHAAFGAPGDYGYESREGKALFALYRFQAELRAVIWEAGGPTQ